MDPNFVLHHDRKPTIFPEGVLRRDPNFMHQLYFHSTELMAADKCGLYFSQAVAASTDPNDQSVRLVNFLKRKYTSESGDPNVNFALDERAAKLYLGFVQHSTDNPELVHSLRIFDLDFDPIDHLGYRRIRVRTDGNLHVLKPDPHVLCVLGGMAICPSNGKLFGHYGMIGVGGRKDYARLAEIELPKANELVLRAKLSDHKFEAVNASRSLRCRGLMFSKLDHLLIFYALCPEPQSNKLLFLCSYDTDLNLVRCLSFDPVDLLNQISPVGEMNAQKSAMFSRALPMAMMLGRVHKYRLFFFLSHILAIKWPKNWYVGQRLPKVQHSRVISVQDFRDKDASPLPFMLTNTHMHFLFGLQDKSYDVRRVALSDRFKDYRSCANCGEIEKGKRMNKDGKRIAQFKVCRLCKEKNFHLFYLNSENACHYCSDECVKNHWKKHKEMHKRGKLNRKKHSSKNLEKFD